MITARTQVCAVIGDPVGHSLSPQLHNAAFQSLGLDFVYVAFGVRRGDAEGAVRAVRSLGLRGLSVTIPHKVDVLAHLDEVDPVARSIGSVNTIVHDGGRLVGHSTDGPGALRALAAEDVSVAGRRILLLGSGGAARALAFTLGTLSPAPTVTILGVEPAELETLVRDLRSGTPLSVAGKALDEGSLKAAMEDAEIVIHATPVGMAPHADATIVPKELIRPDQVVFDVVYTPLETRLLREAASAGATTVRGLGMFVHQAAIQFELWTGRDAPIDLMTQTVLEALSSRK